jgi:hypothetical protein
MSFISDEIFDQGLDYLDTNGVRVDICSQEPSTYAQATSTFSLGNATVNTEATTNAASGTGRRVTIPAVNGATVTTSGIVNFVAVTDNSSKLLVVRQIQTGVPVSANGTFNVGAFDVILRDPV